MHCAQATTQGLKSVCAQRDLPNSAPFRLRTAILTGKCANQGKCLPPKGRSRPLGGRVRALRTALRGPPEGSSCIGAMPWGVGCWIGSQAEDTWPGRVAGG